MALDLFCYCSQELPEAQKLYDAAAEILREQFGAGLFVYGVRDVVNDHREIAREFGIEAASRFLISVSDKENLAPRLKDVVLVLKQLFGGKHILVLLNNETPME